MFREISAISLTVAIVLAFNTFRINSKCKSRGGVKEYWLVWIIKKLTLLVGFLSFIALAVTGFSPRLICDVQIQGYLLMLHATAAPVFMMCIAAMVLLWANSARLSRADCFLMSRISGEDVQEEKVESCKCRRIGFWVICILTIPVILSIILSMVPLFGTHMQEVLFEVHRWCALLLAMTIIVEIGLARK